MKKLVYLIIVILALGLIVSGCIPVVPTAEKDETTSLTKQRPDVKPGTDFNGPHYNLNIIGKKADWNPGGSFDNWDRHTIFVPENTDDWKTLNATVDDIKILMTQWREDNLDDQNYGEDDFAVVDGNACDDGIAKFQLRSGKYDVYIVAKGKPGGNADITGMVWVDATNDYLFPIGTINVSRSKKWKDITDIFYVSCAEDDIGIIPNCPNNDLGMWVFEYLDLARSLDGYEDAGYFWEFINNNIKLIQVRFYEQ
jgi:hypothetical protein